MEFNRPPSLVDVIGFRDNGHKYYVVFSDGGWATYESVEEASLHGRWALISGLDFQIYSITSICDLVREVKLEDRIKYSEHAKNGKTTLNLPKTTKK